MESLLLFVVFIPSIGCLTRENIATGKYYTFSPSVQGKIEFLDWRHNGSLVVEWDSKSGIQWYRYKDRASLNTEIGNLTLHVKKEDSGLFKGQFQVKGTLQYFENEIQVIDPVSKPKVTFEMNDPHITLLCSVDPPVQVEFKWTGPNGFSHVGNNVSITRNEDEDSIYFCTAKNEVSEQTTEFRLKDHLIETVPFPTTGVIITVIVCILVVVIGVVIYLTVFKNRAPAGTRGEMENLGGASQK